MRQKELCFKHKRALNSWERGLLNSLGYVSDGYQEANVVKLTFQLNGAPVDALTAIVHKSNVEHVGRAVALRLKDVLSRQQVPLVLLLLLHDRQRTFLFFIPVLILKPHSYSDSAAHPSRHHYRHYPAVSLLRTPVPF